MIDWNNIIKFYESKPDVDIYSSDPIDPNYYSVSWGRRWTLCVLYKDKIIVGEIGFYIDCDGDIEADYNKSERFELADCDTELYDKLNWFYEKTKLNYKNFKIEQKLNEINKEFK
ncbi:MAG: hypothetical protein J6T10_01415 [Methanobrevibacter sp.]|nr:hypothetical protein [Methanobrevibacter sp.]